MFKRIDHVAIAVKSLDESLATFRQLIDAGVAKVTLEDVPAQKVKVAFLHIGDTKIEFLEPTAADSVVSKFLEKRGEGLHHIALETDEIYSEVSTVKSRGFEPLNEPRVGAEHRLVAFLHPKETNRVLVEIVGQDAGETKAH
ncbi:MAG: methylmalonyl-CoA epimerase [Chlorobiales bacterium]|jgi:methylmalonyl-CoA/ethylmalonyl-CoA epimerase|nr:methylmalonyl-CoA epimerase [Chlorobiales bacterium]